MNNLWVTIAIDAHYVDDTRGGSGGGGNSTNTTADDGGAGYGYAAASGVAYTVDEEGRMVETEFQGWHLFADLLNQVRCVVRYELRQWFVSVSLYGPN